jgi:predicted transcriptional regulator
MEKRIQIGVKLDPELIRRIDAIRQSLPVEATRTACIEQALEAWCVKFEADRKHRGKR